MKLAADKTKGRGRNAFSSVRKHRKSTQGFGSGVCGLQPAARCFRSAGRHLRFRVCIFAIFALVFSLVIPMFAASGTYTQTASGGNWNIELKEPFASNAYYGTVRNDF